ncbi:CHASE2 and HATPase_c domain-containing protein [Paraburkholderia sp.]|uniref:CHASE2 and HATPase_c domain-containing protein n=1 Tax=Paraburkholderia sp. TaxID=1926495 RepID=UPI0025D9B20D|nr:CHASE2 and HATPase_c domain-containing protein [Paraburkholderia sp.]
MRVKPPARPGRSFRRRFLSEWAGVGCAGLLIVILSIVWQWTAGADQFVYDRFLAGRAPSMSSDIAIVEIDDASIAALGRWPWPRSIHARLAEQLDQAGVAAIVYDVPFTEPSPDDDSFAKALAARPAYLPVVLGSSDAAGAREVVLPVAPLANAAAGLGHVNFEVDSDGIVRSVALFQGDAHQHWPQLMVPAWRAARGGEITLSGGAPQTIRGEALASAGREARFLVPFSAHAQIHRRVSFSDVLDGHVPAEWLRDRVALVGVTASGVQDRFATPVSGMLGPLPGVHIHANVLDTLLNGTAIEPVSRPWALLASLVPLSLLLAGFLVLSPWRALLLSVALGVASLAVSAALLDGAHMWLSPVPAVAALIFVYPMWNWRRLEMTMAYLRKALRRLADEPYLLPEAPVPVREYAGDALARQMALMAQTAQRLQDMGRFVWDSLDSVPEPILVADVLGVVLIANQSARGALERLGVCPAEGRSMADVFSEFSLVKSIDPNPATLAFARAHWPEPLNPVCAKFAALMERGVQVRSPDGRDYLLRYAKRTNAQGDVAGWIAGLAEVTALHEAERQREDALQLLSHDMRSPQASIVALVETERKRGTLDANPLCDVMDRIERSARRSLALADDFVQLARAESKTYALEPTSLAELLIDASDEVWPQARARRIRIDTVFEGDEGDAGDESGEGGLINADRSLMTRALVNILDNAVKYSPPDTRIVCAIRIVKSIPPRVFCSIRDEGYGISREDQVDLFAPFRRFHAAQRPEARGTGLGLALVKTVVTRHGGHVYVKSDPGEGTTFTLALPAFEGTV